MPRWSPFDAAADRRLVHGLHEGDDRALRDLYDAYAERLFDYASSLTGDRRTAADVVHDAFVDACRRAPRMRTVRVGLGAWLYGAVRRRCLRQDVTGTPTFPDATPSAAPLLTALADLDPADQELIVLAERHGLTPADAAAATGVSLRRVRARLDHARTHLSTTEPPTTAAASPVPDAQPATVAASTAAPSTAALPEDDEDSVAMLAAREPRPVTGPEGLAAPAPPVLPAALRHRFMHTATDPELAGYRADIAARGGTLTPDGMPTQPDVTSPFTRRWLFTGGGMLGALVTAVVAVLLMGPGIAGTTTYWPPGKPKETPRTTVGPSGGTTGGPTPQPTARAPKLRAGAPPPTPGASGTPSDTPDQGPGTPGGGPSGTPGPRDGTLRVDQAKVELYGTKTGRITLHATGGPVSWQGVASSEQLTLSPAAGTLAAGGTGALTVTLQTGLLNLPGKATVTFADARGALHQVAVEWGASLL